MTSPLPDDEATTRASGVEWDDERAKEHEEFLKDFTAKNAPKSKTENLWTRTQRLTLISAVLGTASVASVAGGVIGAGVVNELAPPQVVTQVVTKNTDQDVNWVNTAALTTQSVVTVRAIGAGNGGEGSGVILDKEGHIVTNNHVVDWPETDYSISVLINHRPYSASIIGKDVRTDLAVIKLDELPEDEELRPIKFSDSNAVAVGSNVMAVGSPLGLAGTSTTGIVSAIGRPITNVDDERISISNAIQTSAPTNPGNSGGALVNTEGELIGINTSIASLTGSVRSGSIGIGFAIPSNLVKNVTEQLIAEKKVEHAFLGVQVSPGALDDGTAAARILSVVEGSPAAEAGIESGEFVIRFEGEVVTSGDELAADILEYAPGDEVGLQVVDVDGVQRQVILELGKAP